MGRTVSIPVAGQMISLENPSAADLLAGAECLLDARQIELARQAFSAAQAAGADPDECCAGRWMTAILAGEFASAWRESDAIRARGAFDLHRFWNGEPLHNKKVIVRCLHGFGDAVQMLRYAPRLRELAAQVIFEVPPRLLELARCFDGVEHVICWGTDEPAANEWEMQLEIIELPYIFRTMLPELPLAKNYLRLPRKVIQNTAAAMGEAGKPRVGLVWAAGEWNPSRSISPTFLEPVLRNSSVEFWNLQGGRAAGASGLECLPGAVQDATKVCGDGLLPLAATIQNLDLVITVDTLAAHLAGALGKPAWVLLQYAADWRWMITRSDSPWYPTLRLFRQRVPGDWQTVIESVQQALQVWSETHRPLPVAGEVA